MLYLLLLVLSSVHFDGTLHGMAEDWHLCTRSTYYALSRWHWGSPIWMPSNLRRSWPMYSQAGSGWPGRTLAHPGSKLASDALNCNWLSGFISLCAARPPAAGIVVDTISFGY